MAAHETGSAPDLGGYAGAGAAVLQGARGFSSLSPCRRGVNQDTAYRFLPLLYKAGGRVFNEDWTRCCF